MKLKYFIPAFIALFALALTSCNDDDSATLLNEIRVSSSYVAIDVNGGSTSITLDATDNWAFVEDEIPAWLTVSPKAGAAGQTEVTFSASSTLDGRTAVLHINCADKQQTINVIQGLPVVEDATCAEVIAGPDSKTYRVTGTVTAIANTVYGNWYLTDETGTIYIYGTLDKSGKDGQNNSIAAWGIEVGDIITVEGPKTTYGTTVELVNVTVIDIQKSLVKVESIDPENAQFPLEGGELTVNLSCKTSNGISVEIPEAAKSWLSIVSISGGSEPVVKFRAAANEGGDRNVTVVFKTTDGKKEYTSEATFTQKGSIIAASVADFLAAEVGDTQYRISGILTEKYTSDKQNKSFYVRDYSGTVLIYRAEGLENAKAGDIVTVVGKRGAYKDNAQMVSGTVEDLKVVTEVSLDEFLTKEDNTGVYYMVTGTVDEIVQATYGNLYLKSGDTRLYVYGTYPGWGATGDFRKNMLATAGIEVGDKLTIVGPKGTYNGTPQVNGGFYFSHEKAQ
ncbi:MAG: BACON domain-containing protein [Muribaculaceae bacterium]|nr:BACON domain-containing protein [Muribaculaceae bacterium]